MCKEDNSWDHARESDWEMDSPTTGIQALAAWGGVQECALLTRRSADNAAVGPRASLLASLR